MTSDPVNARSVQRAPAAISVDPAAVLDRMHARVDTRANPTNTVSVRGQFEAHRRRRVDRASELGRAERRLRWVGTRRPHAARRHHLDEIAATITTTT